MGFLAVPHTVAEHEQQPPAVAAPGRAGVATNAVPFAGVPLPGADRRRADGGAVQRQFFQLDVSLFRPGDGKGQLLFLIQPTKKGLQRLLNGKHGFRLQRRLQVPVHSAGVEKLGGHV